MNEHTAVGHKDVALLADAQDSARGRVAPAPAGHAPRLPGTRRSGRRRAVAMLALLLLAGAAGGGLLWWYFQSAAGVQYSTVALARGNVTRSVTATGSVNPVQSVIVGTYVSGVIQQVLCDFNTLVKQGQVCAKIDPRPFQSAVQQAAANLDAARAQLTKDRADLNYAKLNLDRATKLLQTKDVSQDAFDVAKSNFDKAAAQIEVDDANIEQRQAQLDAARVNLGYTDIVAPIDGVVVSRNVTNGQTVAASLQTPTLFLIAADLAKMQVDANVSESDIGSIRPGQRANFTVDAFPGRVVTGSVTQVRQSPQTVQNVVTYDVIVGVDNPEQLLKPGMTAAVDIVLEQREGVLRVPNQALRYTPSAARTVATAAPNTPPAAATPGRPSANGQATGARRSAAASPSSGQGRVWVLREGEATAVAVVTGLDDGTYTEIVSGEVSPGERVIVSEAGTAQQSTRTNLPIPRF
ncbi:MAG: efflux RND transporter periplasmic adaptor subunit [Bauldia sp.]